MARRSEIDGPDAALPRPLDEPDLMTAAPARRADAATPPVEAYGPQEGPEHYSPDSSWMSQVVLLVKVTPVWLDQLATEYGTDISRLDQVPDAELERIAAAGFTGLWLIGLWERSEASRRIKHLRGEPDAVASAYSLFDYVIAADLGGDPAFEDLRDRARAKGLRLASDMVPNHVGIDGRWVIEHPDWFLALDAVPYPDYTFSGPDLASDDRASVQIEDRYWDASGAAVVFKHHDNRSGETRFIYHGNDGALMPWNDTAQLDYLAPEVREAVIQTILEVARRFPIIRFDAAMTLARRHIKRLWHPGPGDVGAIPSRAEHGMSRDEFDRALPNEFFREVVDRVAAEAPDTLLVAETFWMMEGYFVRTLGMHRVYNSAFMHMLGEERNAEYRVLVKNVLDYDPELLHRFVNFMTTPDEETAIMQFGSSDKYFGVAVVMATLPGLPMFGHGQVEGYRERYGMDYRRPRLREQPDASVVERHIREVTPLMRRRAEFAGADNFLLYDVVASDGTVNDDVFAYSNGSAGVGSLVLYNNSCLPAAGSIRASAPFRDKAADELRTGTLGEGLGVGDHEWLIAVEHVSGLEHLYSGAGMADHGFEVRLGPYEYRVLLDCRAAAGEHYEELAARLGGRGVPSIQAELEAMAR